MAHYRYRGTAAALRGALAIGILVWGFMADAGAATVITTPIVGANNNQIPSCFITNIGTKPATVSVQLVDVNGNGVSTGMDLCPIPPATLGPSMTCEVEAGGTKAVYCAVTSSTSKIRAAMLIFNGTTLSLEVEVPATK